MNLLERVSRIRSVGGGCYKVYFVEDEFSLNEKIYLNEKELYALDELYGGELTKKIIN